MRTAIETRTMSWECFKQRVSNEILEQARAGNTTYITNCPDEKFLQCLIKELRDIGYKVLLVNNNTNGIRVSW